MPINSLGKNLALNLSVYKNANSMLGNTVDSSSSAMATFVGHSFLNSAYSLDVYNIAFLVDSHVCGQQNNPCLIFFHIFYWFIVAHTDGIVVAYSYVHTIHNITI